jgi:hypothetical protein
MSDHEETAHVRWCDTCKHWVHEECGGQAISRSDIAPCSEQSYLTVNTMAIQGDEAMPSDVKIILGWPICRKTREFSLDNPHRTYWHPYSAEKLVTMAREWYQAGQVPEDWRQRLLMSLAEEDQQLMDDKLQNFLSTPYPLYYRCPRCSLYI